MKVSQSIITLFFINAMVPSAVGDKLRGKGNKERDELASHLRELAAGRYVKAHPDAVKIPEEYTNEVVEGKEEEAIPAIPAPGTEEEAMYAQGTEAQAIPAQGTEEEATSEVVEGTGEEAIPVEGMEEEAVPDQGMEEEAGDDISINNRGLVQTTWSGYVNNFDGFFSSEFISPSKQTAAICGISSYHSNSSQDRRFRFKACYPADSSKQGSVITAASFFTDWDRQHSFHCPRGSFISRITAMHSNYYEDRRFQFNCHQFVDHTFGDFPTYTNWVNLYNGRFDFSTNIEYGQVICGIESKHDNRYEDRVFRFKICWSI